MSCEFICITKVIFENPLANQPSHIRQDLVSRVLGPMKLIGLGLNNKS